MTSALTDPRAPRQIRPKRKVVKAQVQTKDLARRYATVVTISRSQFKLRLFKRLKFSKSYGVAVGQPAYPTPTGLFSIANKAVDPAWTAPNSPWAGAYRNETVAGGSAENPLKARWMGIVNGVGIHGTGEPGSIGTAASHGCIRMTVPDVDRPVSARAGRHAGADPVEAVSRSRSAPAAPRRPEPARRRSAAWRPCAAAA